MRQSLFLITSCRLELLQLLLGIFELAQEHFLHIRDLLLPSLNSGLQIINGFQSPLCGSLILDEACLECIVLLLGHDGLLRVLGALCRFFRAAEATGHRDDCVISLDGRLG